MESDVEKLLRDAIVARNQEPFGISFDFLPANFPKDVPASYHKTSKAYLFVWSLDRDAIVDDIEEGGGLRSLIGFVKKREKSPLELFELIGFRFMPAHLKPEFKSFLLTYDWPGWVHRYEEDFDRIFVGEYNDPLLFENGYLTRWHVPPTWKNYDAIAKIIDRRLIEWRKFELLKNSKR